MFFALRAIDKSRCGERCACLQKGGYVWVSVTLEFVWSLLII